MEFSSGIRNLQDGRAIKRPAWRGYVERQMLTAAENQPDLWDSTKANYAIGNKVTYNGSYYICTAVPPAGTLPTDTGYWSPYTLKGEEYVLTFHNRAGTTYQFKYTPNAPDWSNTKAYAVGDKVTYKNKYYNCIQAGTGKQPDTQTAYWTEYLPSATNLTLDRELLTNIMQNDWEEGAATDFAAAAAAQSDSNW